MARRYGETAWFSRWRTLAVTLALPFAVAFCGTRVGEQVDEGSAAASGDAGTQEDDVATYAEVCKRELGITGALPAMSCLSGVEVPITQDQKPVTDETYASLATKGCDNPQWLERACYNYDFVQRVAIQPDVEAVLNCRQKYFTSAKGLEARKRAYLEAPPEKKLEAYKELAELNDLGLILRNVKTGKSCFFTIFGKSFNGAWLPPPDQRATPTKEAVAAGMLAAKVPLPPEGYADAEWVRGAGETYLTPRETAGGNCVGCHDQAAFKLSPFMQQVNVVPAPQTKTLPYLLVGSVFQEAFRNARLLEVTTDPVKGQAQTCTSCHRMVAGGSTCSTFLDWSTGKDPSPRSPHAQAWPQAAWMPPAHGARSAEEYEAKVGAHVKRMKCCCEKPFARGCKTRPFGPTPEELGPLPPGETLPAWRGAPSDASESCLDGDDAISADAGVDGAPAAADASSDAAAAGDASRDEDARVPGPVEGPSSTPPPVGEPEGDADTGGAARARPDAAFPADLVRPRGSGDVALACAFGRTTGTGGLGLTFAVGLVAAAARRRARAPRRRAR